MLGPKPVTVVHFESFGGDWFTDVTKQLKLSNVTNMKADYGVLPDLSKVDWDTDVRRAEAPCTPIAASSLHAIEVPLAEFVLMLCACATGRLHLQRHHLGRALPLECPDPCGPQGSCHRRLDIRGAHAPV